MLRIIAFGIVLSALIAGFMTLNPAPAKCAFCIGQSCTSARDCGSDCLCLRSTGSIGECVEGD